jgi:hypothetical protein
MRIGAGKTAEIAAFADAHAGDEKAHVRLLCHSGRCTRQCKARPQQRANPKRRHLVPPG